MERDATESSVTSHCHRDREDHATTKPTEAPISLQHTRVSRTKGLVG